MENAGTIRVTGRGRLKVHPDRTRITLTLEGVLEQYEEAMAESAKAAEEIRGLLCGLGFEKTDLKTTDWSVDTEYRSYKYGGEYRQKLVGYRYEHDMKVEFDSDNVRLGKILYALAHSPRHPEFRISYTVKDPESVKNRLLGKAVEDAREKGQILAGAAGVTLGKIRQIDYSWGEMRFETSPMDKMVMADCCVEGPDKSYALDIEPDDIDTSDTVTVIWEIG